MTQTEVMQKAAALFAEWKEGDEFGYDAQPFVDGVHHFEVIRPDDVLTFLFNDYDVKIKPKPVRRLKATWEIVKEAERLGRLTVSKMGQVFIGDSSLWNIIDCNDPNSDLHGIEVKDWPDWFFTTETPTPPVDRIADMAQVAAYRYAPTDAPSQRVLRGQLESLICEECASRGIT